MSAAWVSSIGACSPGAKTGKGCSPAADGRGAGIGPTIGAGAGAGASAVVGMAVGRCASKAGSRAKGGAGAVVMAG